MFVSLICHCEKSLILKQSITQPSSFRHIERKRNISNKPWFLPCMRFFGLRPLNDSSGLHEIHRLRLWMTWKVCQFWLLSKHQTNKFRIRVRNDRYYTACKNWLQSLNETMKNSCCLSDSEFTSLGLNLVTVFSRRCFSFLSNVLSFFFAIKKKEYLVRGWGSHTPQYKNTNIDRSHIRVRKEKKYSVILSDSESSLTSLVLFLAWDSSPTALNDTENKSLYRTRHCEKSLILKQFITQPSLFRHLEH